MKCRDVRQAADSFLSEDLLTDTNRELRWHLEICPACRTEIGARFRIRRSLQTAFERTSSLQPRPDLVAQLRERLREAAVDERRRRPFPGQWFAIAAAVVLLALGGVVIVNRGQVDVLAGDARGDHWNCALKNRVNRTPLSLEEAARQYDSTYRQLVSAPPDDMSTPDGPVHVIERHSCVYGTRRFAHVILRHRDRIVSLLVTMNDDASDDDVRGDSSPHVHGSPVNGLTVVSVRATRHAVLLVGDLGEHELTRLSKAVSVPLAQQLQGSAMLPDPTALAALVPVASAGSLFRRAF